MPTAPTIASLAADLAAGRTTSTALTEAAFERIADPSGEGVRVFTRADRDEALAQARASDLLRAHGIVPSPLAGLPISVKDLFDLAGQVTTAGSVVLKDSPPALVDAPAMARLRAAGAVIIGRTNMTEFAFSGLGLNPHYGTPGNPFDRARIPGGSSSGAAISVTDGMAVAAIGTDTGGSIRIPSAFCGLAGFKPTQHRIPREGTLPLARTLDTIGPLGRSVACCAVIDAILAGEAPCVPAAASIEGLRLAVPQQIVLDGLDATVSAAFSRALTRLSQAGARVIDFVMPALARIPVVNAKGGFVSPEALSWHKDLLARRVSEYDPRVASRILRGAEQSAVDMIDLIAARAAIMAEAANQTRDIDALLLPTVPFVAPRIDELATDADYARINILALRNPSLFNFLDRPAITIPCASDGLPVGVMLVGRHCHDRRLLALAQAVEPVVI